VNTNKEVGHLPGELSYAEFRTVRYHTNSILTIKINHVILDLKIKYNDR